MILGNRWIRATVSMAISVAFIVITLANVDFGLLHEAWANTSLVLVAVAVGLSAGEVGMRAWRWRSLLQPLAAVSYPVTYGLLSIGHLANALLPARLGDLARALMAGSRLGISRASVLGTVAVERVADAALLVGAASLAIVFGYRGLEEALVLLVLGGVTAAAALAGAIGLFRQPWLARTRIGAIIVEQGRLVAAGALSLRDRARAARVLALTLVSFAFAILILQAAAAAVGIGLPVWQAAVVIAAVTLSTAIPAGPASIGTYEFVGVSVMTSMGFAAEPSLLVVALVHGVATLTPSVIGLFALWAMGTSPVESRLGTRPALVSGRSLGRSG